MSTIIGIDPGLADTGYGIIKTGKSRQIHIAHGTIRTGPDENLAQRLLTIYREIIRLVEFYKPDKAGVETLYFAKNIKTAIPVAQARGAALVALASLGISPEEYTPLEIKQAVAGRGRAEKNQVQQMVKIIFGLSEVPAPDHAADALAVAYVTAIRQNYPVYIEK